MLNFRRLKQEFAPAMLKDGKNLHDKEAVTSAKILKMSAQAVRLSCRVAGNFDNSYHCEVEVDRRESMAIDSDCDCPHKYDCHHLAAFLFFLEERFEEMVVNYSKETNLDKSEDVDEQEKATLLETFKEAESKEVLRRTKKNTKELLQEYIGASLVLGRSPFFLPEEVLTPDKAEFAFIVFLPQQTLADLSHVPELQISLRLPYRSKPLNIPNLKEFFDAIRYGESLYIGSKRYFFNHESFDAMGFETLKMIMDFARFSDNKEERGLRFVQIDAEAFGSILARIYDRSCSVPVTRTRADSDDVELQRVPFFYCGTLEEPLRLSASHAMLRFELEYLESSAPKILLKPEILLEGKVVRPEDVCFLECATPGVVYHNTYFRFQPCLKRKHLRNMSVLRDITIPEPLFGTFVENSIPEFKRFAQISNCEIIERFVTLPFVQELEAECDIHFLDGELEASLYFIYNKIKVPAAPSKLTIDHVLPFVTKEGILARNLTDEQKIIEDLFQDFVYDSSQGVYKVKNDKKTVEFMTEVIPRNQHRVKFNCPENLLDHFIYDDTQFVLSLKETDRIDVYAVDLKVNGHLAGATIDQLWECLASRRSFIEIAAKKIQKKKSSEVSGLRSQKILVLDLDKLAPVVQVFDEIGINVLDDHEEERPLWSLASIDAEQFKNLPIRFTMSPRLQEIQQQMLGISTFIPQEIPSAIQATLRTYQVDGVSWLERLRQMHLNGILADDMGLGKTLQAITAITQQNIEHPKSLSIIVCPTSLVHNWKEEFLKFNPNIKVLAVDGTPVQRKKLLTEIKNFDAVITSYSLLQKDVEIYKSIPFAYAILDEAQHIKNRGTRNAKSVKMIQARHRLILTGTPIENSLDELWSLFDFLMPGLLSSYDRFVEKYIRSPNQSHGTNIEVLRRKVSPFILRRMKKDVLSELPPVSEIVYHCHLSDVQRELYHSYAQSAREELSKLVKKEGFDKIQIHVLATLTRLKQICCHPAIFAKDKAEAGDSAKYEMFLELLQTLIESNHKTVIFSQYTRMLGIMREDLIQRGIPFEYLDGSSKNRMAIVKRFNEDEKIPVFLVSLKAGGAGLNLIGADTVIHYDMWWNPAVENQATDRVHRIGQKNSVSAYKLVTLNSIEEKIIDLQNRKRGIVKKIITCDEEAIGKLTWEEVLELLQT
ncbi:MAG: DEAD/DEAH box helicase [Parachlamydiaceae bacterium]